MRPVVSALERKYGEQVEFIVVDVATTEGLTLAQRYRITATPTYLFITGDGDVQNQLRGLQEAATMEAAMEGLLQTSERERDPQEQLAAALANNERVMLSFILPG